MNGQGISQQNGTAYNTEFLISKVKILNFRSCEFVAQKHEIS